MIEYGTHLEELDEEQLVELRQQIDERLQALRAREDEDDEAERQGDDSERPDGVPAKASITVKTINDNRYEYYQWRDGDRVKSKYKGPASK